MKSFKQYLKEYASAVRNEEDDIEENDTEESEDEELAVALTRSGEGGQAVLDAMQQGGLLHNSMQRVYERAIDALSQSANSDPAEIARLSTQLGKERKEQRMRSKIRSLMQGGFGRSIQTAWDIDQRKEYETEGRRDSPLDPSFDPPSEIDQTYTPVPSYKTVPPETDNTKGKDQEMLDTIAGTGDSLDRPIQREDGSAFLSALRAAGLTFDAKWPVNVDRYDRVQQRVRDVMNGK